MAHCTKQTHQILVARSCRFSGGVHACAKKNFVCVKVADSGDQLLVQQDRFHCAAVISNNCLELREANVKRVGTKAAFLQKFIDVLYQFDLAKFALIIEHQPAVIRETENHSRSFRRYFVVVEVFKRPGHAEMESQPELITGAHKQMFAVSMTAFEATFVQSPFQPTRGNALQNICITNVDTGDPLMQ